jgi:hypothetical protein
VDVKVGDLERLREVLFSGRAVDSSARGRSFGEHSASASLLAANRITSEQRVRSHGYRLDEVHGRS